MGQFGGTSTCSYYIKLVSILGIDGWLDAFTFFSPVSQLHIVEGDIEDFMQLNFIYFGLFALSWT